MVRNMSQNIPVAIDAASFFFQRYFFYVIVTQNGLMTFLENFFVIAEDDKFLKF